MKLRLLIFCWVTVSSLLFMAPPPWEWGDWAQPLMYTYVENQHAIQTAAHIVLMGGCAFLLQLLFRRYGSGRAFMLALILTMLFAAGMEIVQGFLPRRFHRESDLMDLWPGLIGALVGCAIGWALTRRKA